MNGVGVGPGVGLTLGPETARKTLNALKEGVLKLGDLQSIIDAIKKLNLTGPSETSGPVLSRFT